MKGRRLISRASALRIHQLAYWKEKGSGDTETSLPRDKLRHSELASIRPDKDNEIHGNSTALLVFRTVKVARGDGLVTHV